MIHARGQLIAVGHLGRIWTRSIGKTAPQCKRLALAAIAQLSPKWSNLRFAKLQLCHLDIADAKWHVLTHGLSDLPASQTFSCGRYSGAIWMQIARFQKPGRTGSSPICPLPDFLMTELRLRRIGIPSHG
jgi:hypothetical protein